MQINQECIKEIYESHELVTEAFIVSKELKFFIFLFHDESLMVEHPIQIAFKNNESLLPHTKEKGNIVKIEFFVLREKYRKKGICKNIHEQEVRLYKSYNIKQMQLIATYSGFFAWSKLGFLCCNNDEEKAKRIVIFYLIQNTESISESLEQEDFLSLLNEIKDSDNFLKWANDTDTQIKISMYKDI